MKKSELVFSAILIPVDFLMVFLAGLLSYRLRFYSFVAEIKPAIYEIIFKEYLNILLIASVVFIIIFALTGLYAIKSNRRIIDEIGKIFVACTASIALLIIFIFFRREWFSSRFIILVGWVCSILLVSIGRVIVRSIQHGLLRKGLGAHYIVIIGQDKNTDDIMSQIHQWPSLGYKIVDRYNHFDSDSQSKILEKLKIMKIDEIIAADPNLVKEEILFLKDFCYENHITFKYIADLFESQAAHIEINTIADIPIIEVKRTKLDGWGKIFKRSFDIIVSLILLIILSPVFLFLAIIIKIDSVGPIFARLDRVGEKGKKFKLYKFRSMIKDAQALKKDLVKLNERADGPLFKIKNDPRITRFGKFLRKSSFDELPQFFNVFVGQMSLVGPRPHEPEEVARYQKHHIMLLTIKPGMTGMAQISGRSELKFDDEARLDIYYIENWSPKLDIQIILKTPMAVLAGKSAS